MTGFLPIPECIIVGFTARPIRNLWDYIEEPQAPGNYGDEAAARWLSTKGAEARHKREQEASLGMHTGRVTSICAVDINNRVVYRGTEGDNGVDPCISFCDWLLTLHPDAFPTYVGDTARRGVTFWGFDIESFLQLTGTACARAKTASVPAGLWQNNSDALDPYRLLTRSDSRKFLSPAQVLAMCSIKAKADYQPHADSLADSLLAAELMSRMGLIDVSMDKILQEMLDELDSDDPDEEAPPEAEEEDVEEEDEDEEYEYVDEDADEVEAEA